MFGRAPDEAVLEKVTLARLPQAKNGGSSYGRRWSLAKRPTDGCSGGNARHRTRGGPERRDHTFAHNKGKSAACASYRNPARGKFRRGSAAQRRRASKNGP